jgi:hypothetical protein
LAPPDRRPGFALQEITRNLKWHNATIAARRHRRRKGRHASIDGQEQLSQIFRSALLLTYPNITAFF